MKTLKELYESVTLIEATELSKSSVINIKKAIKKVFSGDAKIIPLTAGARGTRTNISIMFPKYIDEVSYSNRRDPKTQLTFLKDKYGELGDILKKIGKETGYSVDTAVSTIIDTTPKGELVINLYIDDDEAWRSLINAFISNKKFKTTVKKQSANKLVFDSPMMSDKTIRSIIDLIMGIRSSDIEYKRDGYTITIINKSNIKTKQLYKKWSDIWK